MDSDSDYELQNIKCTPPDITAAANITSLDLLPAKSRTKYQKVFQEFMKWRCQKNINSFSENVLLAYFGELAPKYKSSSLWATYSMLRSTILLNENVNIALFSKLRAFLKRKSEGYEPKKAKVFTPEQINAFINDAPDNTYLATKVALIFGLMGACRSNELHAMKIEDFQDLGGSAVLVTVPKTKTKVIRKFTITGKYYAIYKQYMDLRLCNMSSFFLNFQNGKCTSQNIGINKFSGMGKQIAVFLQLPDPQLYTGHCFRRSSATLLVDAGADISSLKRHGGWKSSAVAEGYVDNSMKSKMDAAKNISDALNVTTLPAINSTSNSTVTTLNTNNNLEIPSSFNFSNCNVTVNFNK